ncbi:MAG TPA: hypothetical protein VFX98_03210, partial [Longimicrobiaceae bacterium]|nr:hypothetical protein [Longimicrobiaceae bacterium]
RGSAARELPEGTAAIMVEVTASKQDGKFTTVSYSGQFPSSSEDAALPVNPPLDFRQDGMHTLL